MQAFLAVDIGASSGRHILGWVEGGALAMKEVYRFANGAVRREGRLCWDVDRLFREILAGMKRCAAEGILPCSMGIDTWAVDYALLGRDGELLAPVAAYRDSRTAGMDQKVYARVPERELYARTGIQKQPFNTIYQLTADREQNPGLLERAERLLLMPDYFHFLLTGRAAAEYTNATTTQLVNARGKGWDWDLIRACGFPERLFPAIRRPGEALGPLKPEIAREVGFSCEVALPATHDTASAVLAVPCREDAVYVSSGTWSLMGTELPEALCTEEAQRRNFTNEGGYGFRFRFLKNIMGLWMIQSLQREEPHPYSFAELCRMAEEHGEFPSRVDANDGRFLAPRSMKAEIREFCRESGQPVPETTGEYAAVIYQSLAASYGETLRELESLLGRRFPCVHVIGGGSNAAYLNRLTAQRTGLPVLAGPAEATAAGNLAAQMIRAGVFRDLADAREWISRSFEIERFEPEGKGENI